MTRSPMIKKLEQEKNKKSSLVKSIATLVASSLIIGSGIARGVHKYLEKQEQEVADAFAGNCGHRIVTLYNYGHYKAQPNAIAREQFEQLREQFPERFRKIFDNEGVSQLMDNYDAKQEEFNIPKYDCE